MNRDRFPYGKVTTPGEQAPVLRFAAPGGPPCKKARIQLIVPPVPAEPAVRAVRAVRAA